MKKYIPAFLVAAGLVYGASDLGAAEPKTVNFDVTDIPGYWFDTGTGTGNRSLHIINPGDTVTFTQNDPVRGRTSESVHTVTSLIFPSAVAESEKLAQPAANYDNHHVKLTTPGLTVFVCKVHPYMLGGVIVDDPNTTTVDKNGKTVPAYDIGNAKGGANDLHLEGVGDFPSNSNLGLRLLRAFFIVTTPSNWKDYTKVNTQYKPVYPAVPVALTNGVVPPLNLNEILQATFDGDIIPAAKKPSIKGVGEVWVDTQYELTDGKGPHFPGTISVVEVGSFFPDRNWKVKRKIALPRQKMNNGHNMWASHDQRQIYQTEWHGSSLFVIDRLTGAYMQEIKVGEDPAHVMTRVDTRQVHVGLNGEDSMVELNRNKDGYLLS